MEGHGGCHCCCTCGLQRHLKGSTRAPPPREPKPRSSNHLACSQGLVVGHTTQQGLWSWVRCTGALQRSSVGMPSSVMTAAAC